MDNLLIELIQIKKTYGTNIKTDVLKGINLKLSKGEFTSIIGPSGSGKSTLLNILGTLDTPTSGKYLFDGVNIENLSSNGLALLRNKKIGFVFQFHHLLPEFTAIENVLMPYMIGKRPISKDIVKKAERLLALVGILKWKDNKSTNLSGGQQQRVAIARSMMNDPPLILADEPTGNLDSESADQVYGLLRDINRDLGTSIVIVTHDKQIAAKSDRIIEIKDGNVVGDLAV